MCETTRKRSGCKPKPMADRFHAGYAVDENRGCWVWQRVKSAAGYGQMTVGSKADGTNRRAYAHRIAYELIRGPIPAGTELDHLCRNRACCNPWHLDAVPHMINYLRGNAPRRLPTCRRGHVREGRACNQCRNLKWLDKRDRVNEARRQSRAEARA